MTPASRSVLLPAYLPPLFSRVPATLSPFTGNAVHICTLMRMSMNCWHHCESLQIFDHFYYTTAKYKFCFVFKSTCLFASCIFITTQEHNCVFIQLCNISTILSDVIEKITAESVEKQATIVVHEVSELKVDEDQEQNNIIEEEQKLQNQTNQKEENQEISIPKNQNEEVKSSNEDDENKTSEIIDDEKKFEVRKLFVHSQWLSVQSPYFKALFYSGMKETYSKEVVMKIYEHELEAHLVLIEAMYRLDVLNDKEYRLIVQVLILANKYDVPLLIKKCKYVLMATTPSLEMSEYILQETEHLTEMNLVHDMLQTFLVKEFTPFDEIWTTEKFTDLSKAAVRLLLKSDDLATESENTIFVALMKWVRGHWFDLHDKCDLLDVVRFELMSADFLYDVVRQNFWAKRMPGFTDYLQKGLAYHAFSDTRKEQVKIKPKKRPPVKVSGPTFSWVIDDKLEKELSKCPGTSAISETFCYKGYRMKMILRYSEDSTKCSFFFSVLGLKGEACLCVSYKAKSSLFISRTLQSTKRLYTASSSSWGYEGLQRNQSVKVCTIDVWVEIA